MSRSVSSEAPDPMRSADADCRHPIPRADRLAADKPKYETAGGGAGEGALVFGTPCAISLAVPLHRDRADARDPPDESSKSAAGTATAKSQRASLRHKLRCWCLSTRRTLRSATNPIVKIAISAMLW